MRRQPQIRIFDPEHEDADAAEDADEDEDEHQDLIEHAHRQTNKMAAPDWLICKISSFGVQALQCKFEYGYLYIRSNLYKLYIYIYMLSAQSLISVLGCEASITLLAPIPRN